MIFGLLRMIGLGLVLFLVYLLALFLRGVFSSKNSPVAGKKKVGSLVQDPHCGCYIDRTQAVKMGKNFFCSKECGQAYADGKKG